MAKELKRVIETTVGELPPAFRAKFAGHPDDMPVALWCDDGPIEALGSKSEDAVTIAWMRARWDSARLSPGWLLERQGQ